MASQLVHFYRKLISKEFKQQQNCNEFARSGCYHLRDKYHHGYHHVYHHVYHPAGLENLKNKIDINNKKKHDVKTNNQNNQNNFEFNSLITISSYEKNFPDKWS